MTGPRSGREHVWQQLSRELGGTHGRRGLFGTEDRVQARSGDWIVTLDTLGDENSVYSRMRAPFVNPSGFRFCLYRAGFFTDLARGFGLQDVEVGDPEFDARFVVQSTSLPWVRALFANPQIRALALAQPNIHLSIADQGQTVFQPLPRGVDELRFMAGGIITDLGVLRGLFDLFAEVLQTLSWLNAGNADALDQQVARLQAPGGQTREGDVFIWEGDTARREAAERLRQARDPRALPALLRAVGDLDPCVRATAICALGESGDPRAVAALVPVLGDAEAGRLPVVEALTQLGEGELAAAFNGALSGEAEARAALLSRAAPEVIEALGRVLSHAGPAHTARAASLLAELGCAEALPAVRRAMRRHPHRGNEAGVNELLAWALDRLEFHTTLPRPAEAPARDAGTLPRPAEAPARDAGALPIPGSEEA